MIQTRDSYRDDDRDPKPAHPSWTPMRRYNLASDADECDGCHRRLVEDVSAP